MSEHDVEAVSAANADYYDAFERQDFAVMASVWEHSDRTSCTHPGWSTLRGSDLILQSYQAIFEGPQTLQVILTNPHVVVEGSMAYVTVDENLVDQGGNTGSTAALNVFVQADGEGRWRMVAHHGSPIVGN